MNTELVQAAATATLTGTKSFPEIVGMLLEAGVEYYHVDYVNHRLGLFPKGSSEDPNPLKSSSAHYLFSYASIPTHEQTGLRSPKTLSTRATCGQNL